MREIDILRRGYAWLRKQVVVVITALLLGAALGATIGSTLAQTSYRARVAVAIKPNLGGLKINSYTDASAESVAWTQPGLLNSIRPSLTGAALKDPGALLRVKCAPETGDRVVTCTTTSSNARAPAAVLNQMVRSVIPIETSVIQGTDRITIGEHHEAWVKLGKKDRNLTKLIARLSGERLTPSRRDMLRFYRLQLASNSQIRPQILVRIASIRRQSADTRKSFQPLGHATVAQVSQTPGWLTGGLIGSGTALLLVIFRTLWLSIREPVPVTPIRSRAKTRKILT